MSTPEEMLKWLSKDYYIVPKNKVQQFYKEVKEAQSKYPDNYTLASSLATLEEIFDKSLFNEV